MMVYKPELLAPETTDLSEIEGRGGFDDSLVNKIIEVQFNL